MELIFIRLRAIFRYLNFKFVRFAVWLSFSRIVNSFTASKSATLRPAAPFGLLFKEDRELGEA